MENINIFYDKIGWQLTGIHISLYDLIKQDNIKIQDLKEIMYKLYP